MTQSIGSKSCRQHGKQFRPWSDCSSGSTLFSQRMHRLMCAFVVRICHNQVFSCCSFIHFQQTFSFKYSNKLNEVPQTTRNVFKVHVTLPHALNNRDSARPNYSRDISSQQPQLWSDTSIVFLNSYLFLTAQECPLRHMAVYEDR